MNFPQLTNCNSYWSNLLEEFHLHKDDTTIHHFAILLANVVMAAVQGKQAFSKNYTVYEVLSVYDTTFFSVFLLIAVFRI